MLLIEKDLNHGDHIYVRRKGLLYSHHGIIGSFVTITVFATGTFILKAITRKRMINFLSRRAIQEKYHETC